MHDILDRMKWTHEYVQLANIGVVLKRARPYIKVKDRVQSRLEAFT